MKKFLCSLIAIIMVFAFVGCMGGNNNAVLAKRINKNTSNLLNALNNLEEVTQEDIVISEFNNNTVNSTIINNTYSPYRANKVSKIKQLFRRNNLVEIKNMIDNNNQKFENEKISTNLVKNDVYSPKYISNEDDKLNYLDIYKSKIENLYNASSDCSFINSECIKCQQELKTSINECKSLCEKLANGEIKLTEEEMNLCSTYCNQMNSCYKKIKDCRGDCTNYLKTLKMLKTYFGSNSETLSTNYLNLLGCLENRLSCYKEALECVNNCNNLLKSNYNPTNIYNNQNETNNQNYVNNNKNNNLNNNNINNNQNNINNQNNSTNNAYNNGYNNGINNANSNYNNGYNSNNGIYNNGFNSNNGYYNNGFNNGIYNNPYNQTPNNVNTYGPINRNIDTYRNIKKNNNTYYPNNNYNQNNMYNENTNNLNNKNNNSSLNNNTDNLNNLNIDNSNNVNSNNNTLIEKDTKQNNESNNLDKNKENEPKTLEYIENNKKFPERRVYPLEKRAKDIEILNNEKKETENKNQEILKDNQTENKNNIEPKREIINYNKSKDNEKNMQEILEKDKLLKEEKFVSNEIETKNESEKINHDDEIMLLKEKQI